MFFPVYRINRLWWFVIRVLADALRVAMIIQMAKYRQLASDRSADLARR